MTKPKIKPRNGNGGATPPSSAFEQRVREFVQLEAEWRQAGTLGACKLSRDAFLREAIDAAHATPQRIEALREELRTARTAESFALLATVRRMAKEVRGVNWPSPPPPGEDRRLRFFFDDLARSALAVHRCTPSELFACAVAQCGEQHPESFGTCENTALHAQRLKELGAQREKLAAELSSAWTPEDLQFADLSASGTAKVTFRMSDGAIPIYPQSNCAERLANFLLSQPQQ